MSSSGGKHPQGNNSEMKEPEDMHSHSNGACADEKCNGHKNPPIFEAIKAGMLIPIQTLFEQGGAEVFTSRDDKGHTPAHWACLGGHTTILRFMLEHKAPVNEPSNNDLGARPIHWACVNGHIAVVDILVQSGVLLDIVDNKGCTPLIVAAQYGQTMLSGYLMGKGARLQLVDKDGDSALHWAAFKGHSELMRLLIYSGFNPRQRDNYGQTPLHLACINGNLTAVKELCEQDSVEIDLADKNSKTPLMLAVGRKHENIISYLKKEARFKASVFPRIDCWAIMFGPPGNSKGALLFFLISVVCWGYPMYLIKCLPLTFYELQPFHLLFITVNIFMWICLYHCNTIDPGFLPRNIPEYDQAIKQVAHFDEWKQGQNPLSRLCHTCRTVKPVRAKHCRVCNRCVKEFDHHCPYIYNCVGYNNRGSFLVFVTLVAICGVLSMYLAYEILVLENWVMRKDYILGIFLLVVFEVIAINVSAFTVLHAGMNLTTNERINRKRYEYLKDGRGQFYNPFNKGPQHNFMEYFHLRKPPYEHEVQFLTLDV
ncbi:probable protein S-acyltransferase 23 isoform X1 [Haliotis rubra]|uniref:probable protein S-acyltransferase 23 isoform X1 n=1 Tax=Haliotis rubra TaxID=36100 RepID=UPI001EE5FE59|nr:probable protein S-acyltransferase 23 isoform X1 [Haliotis rubra]